MRPPPFVPLHPARRRVVWNASPDHPAIRPVAGRSASGRRAVLGYGLVVVLAVAVAGVLAWAQPTSGLLHGGHDDDGVTVAALPVVVEDAWLVVVPATR